jgi:enterobacteria phage integrase
MNPADLAGILELMAQALRLLPAGAVAAPTPAVQRTFGDWLDVHWTALQAKGYKAHTLKNRKSLVGHCRRLWGGRPIGEIRPHEIAAGLKTFPPARSSTAQRVHAEVRDAYADAIAQDWCSFNPAHSLKPPKHRVKRARLTLETWQALRTLAQAGPQRWVESLLLLALVTGQRRGDLAAMRFDHIVTGADGSPALRVEQIKQAGKGYGSRVEIPLSLRLDAIGMTLADVIAHCRGSAKPGPNLLRKAGGGPIEQSSLSARFHDHIKAVLPEGAHQRHEWPSLHEIRSLSARLYRDQGLDVQTLLGHKDAEVTGIYLDDRGLSAKEWKRVGAATQTAEIAPRHQVRTPA